MQEQFFISSVTSHFNLRHHKIDKPSPIYMVIRVNEKQYKVSLGVKVLPQHFNKDKALISIYNSKLDNKNNKIVNDTILEYQEKFISLQKILSDDIEQLDDIKGLITRIFGMKKKVNKPLAIAVLTQLLLEQPMKDSSKTSYFNELNSFKDYIKSLKREIYLEDIDVPFMRDYIKYLRTLTDTHKITKEKVFIEDNTVAGKFKKLLTILGYADKADMIDVSKINKLKELFKTDKTEENQVYLNDEEIERLLSLSLTGEKEQVRDIFVFQLEIGQRVSDVIDLMGKDLSSMVKDGKLVIIQEKTGHKVTPPITSTIENILKKYNYVLPKMTLNKINIIIKKVCEEANINDNCDCVEMRGGKPYKYSCPKYLLIASHTCRRSFISQNIKDGVDSSILKKITGHSTDSAFQRYNRLSSEDAADTFAKIKNKALQGSGNNKVENVPSDNIPVKSSAFPEEIKGVLTMLNVPPVEWVMLDDVESLYRVLITNENIICDKLGCDYKYLKDLWNNPELSLREKITIITNKLN